METQTLSDFYQESFLTRPAIAGGSPATRATYAADLANLQRYFGERVAERPVTLADLSAELIESAMAWQLARGRSRPTANRLRRSLLAIWNHAHRRGKAPAVEPIEKLAEPKQAPEAWSTDELERLLEATTQLPGKIGGTTAALFWESLIRTVWNTGGRISAVMTTPTRSLNLATGLVTIPWQLQKDREDLLFELLPGTITALQRLDPAGRGLQTIFADWPYDRGVAQWPALNLALRKLIVSAGLRDSVDQVTRKDLWHKVRRSFATYLTAKHGIAVAQSKLGHSSIEVTNRYLDRSKLGELRISEMLIDLQPQRLRVFDPASTAS